MPKNSNVTRIITLYILLDLIYLTCFFGAYYFPSFLKILLTGSVGPKWIFLSLVLICPLLFLILGAFAGRQSFLIHLLMLTTVFIYAWVSYPADPEMNFTRQFPQVLIPPMVVGYGLGPVVFVWAVVSGKSRF